MAENKSASKTDNIESLVALYTGVSQNLSMVHAADDAVENKITAFLAGSLVILTLVLSRTHTWRVLSFLGVGLLCITILVSIYALWSRNYNSVAVKVGDNLDYIDMENRDLILQLIADAEDSYTKSHSILVEKAKLYQWVLILFSVGSAISLLSFYIKIVGV